MPPEELTLILKLRDEATKQLKSVRGTVTAVGGAMAATGLKVGADWAAATKTIVDGTGATGPALKTLQADFQAVAHLGADEAATAIADLNTHLGLTGPELQDVSAMALKANIDTSKFGAVAEQAGLDVDGYKNFLDDLTVAGQATGVSTDQLLDTIGKNSARWQAGGGDVTGLTAHVVELASEFGPTGLRGAMSETMAEVDTGVMPTFVSLNTQLGDTTGAVEKTYLAGRTWRDVLGEVKDGAIAYAGPAGDMLAGVGSLAVGVATMGPHLVTMATNTGLVSVGQKALNLVMSLNPIGLVITAIGALVAVYVIWKDEINNFLKLGWNLFITAIEGGINILRPLASLIGIDLPADLGKYKFATEEAETATTDAAAEIAVLRDEATTLAPAVKAAKVEIEAFDLSTVNMKTQIQQAKPEIKDIGDLLEAAGLQTGTSALEFGYYADEADILSGKMATHKTTIPPMILEMMTPPPSIEGMGERTGNEWSAGFFAALQRSFEGGGGLMGGIKSSMTEGFGALFAEEGALAPVAEKWGQAMEAIGGIPVVGPFLKAFGPAIIGGVVKLGKKAWSALKGIFGKGTNVAEDAYQAIADNSTAAAAADSSLQQHLTTGLEHGLDDRAASVRAFFLRVRMDQGESWAEANADFQMFHNAMTNSDKATRERAAETADKLMADYLLIEGSSVDVADASEEAWAASYTAQTVTSVKMTDEAIANSLRLKEAVVADTVELLTAWRDMAQGMQDSWMGAGAEIESTSEYTADAIIDDAGRVRTTMDTEIAAVQTTWTSTLGRLRVLTIEATGHIETTWRAMVGNMVARWIGDDGLGMMELRAIELLEFLHGTGTGGIFGKVTDWAIAGFDYMRTRWDGTLTVMEARAVTFASNVNASLASIRDRTVTITTAHRTVGAPGGGGVASPFGGGSSPAPAPSAPRMPPITVVVPQDAVTDSVLRAAPGREALRGWA